MCADDSVALGAAGRPRVPERRMTHDATADVLLTDGTIASIRPLRVADGPALHALHEDASDEALRLRFFAPGRHAAHAYIDHLLTHAETLARVVERHGALIGLGTAEPLTPHRSEVAFMVAEEARGLGVGTLLLEHLCAAALERGIDEFEADVLAENHAMLSVVSDAGYDYTRSFDAGIVVLRLGTAFTPGAMARSDEREFRAETASLRSLMRPEAVAVVGVSSDGTGPGAAVLRSIESAGFRGRLVAVRSDRLDQEVGPAYHSLLEVPGRLDLVIVCAPAPEVLAILQDAVERGAGVAVVMSPGFAELGVEGARMQHRLASWARSHDLRIVGPNCRGPLVNDPDIRLNATCRPAPPSGRLAIASQSGGVALVLSELARHADLGIHSIVSLGNKADVSSNDLLAAWFDDPAVAAAALYLESFGNAAKFARFARRFARRKPLMAVVGGRPGSTRADGSHLRAGTTTTRAVEALFAQAGVIACRDAEDLAGTAVMLTEQPLPRGRRLVILSNTGGVGLLAADAAVRAGLEVCALSTGLQARMAEMIEGPVEVTNPIDAGTAASAALMARLLDAVLDSGEADAVLVTPVVTGVVGSTVATSRLSRVRERHPEVPVVAVSWGGAAAIEPGDSPMTTYTSTSQALSALGRASWYRQWLDRQGGGEIDGLGEEAPDQGRDAATRDRARALLGDRPSAWLTAAEVRHLLQAPGLPPLALLMESAEDASGRAAGRGVPAPTVGGTAMALRMLRDPLMGPLVMVGPALEPSEDRVFLVPPVSLGEVELVLRSLRVARLLEAAGSPPERDLEELAAHVVGLCRLALDVPEVAEVALDAVAREPGRPAVVEARVRLAGPVGPDYAAPSQLRPLTSDAGRGEGG